MRIFLVVILINQYKKIISKLNSAFFYNAILLLFVAVVLTACKKDEPVKQQELIFETEEYSAPTEDALTVVSDLPAYIIAHDYKNFGAALVNRMQNKVAAVNDDTLDDLASVVMHISQIATIEEWDVILVQLLMGRNIIIIEPTLKDFKEFCDMISSMYLFFQVIGDEEGLIDALEIIPGVRQTLEAFYEMSTVPEKIESMFLLDTDSNGIFAEAIAVRGCDFHIVDRMKGVAEVETTYEKVVDEEGNTEPTDAPEVESNTNTDAITPYSYGLFADMFTKWINEQEYYVNMEEQIRNRAIKTFNTRASETTKYNLEDITSVQKVQYTISAALLMI